MNHKVNSVANLYETATALHKNVVDGANGSATTVIQNLREGIEVLKANWEGTDAGVQINNVVNVCNAFAAIKNVLDALAVEASKIAVNYRAIQKANGANYLEDLAPIREYEAEGVLPEYTDTRDTISIQPAAESGMRKLEAALNDMPGFMLNIKKEADALLENWTSGAKREEFKQTLEDFYAHNEEYKQMLEETVESVKTALRNYSNMGNI